MDPVSKCSLKTHNLVGERWGATETVQSTQYLHHKHEDGSQNPLRKTGMREYSCSSSNDEMTVVEKQTAGMYQKASLTYLAKAQARRNPV